ncbi:hypothetical protein [Plebeiibacterium marinum]|uniref:Uncharacterized protein n=1 Tax=Plebeiibacterium marinum TaxID=2992111 RepID=A0AAE3MG56_9BACT|nr:hypothetical protein [Plebeiobacterium marinum]MCW3807116.1 hypothetical protein [Plebeiobacterium marinum]
MVDSISNERIKRVGQPGIYTFFASKQENKRAAVLICPGGAYKHQVHICMILH